MADEPIAKIPYSLNSKAVADATKVWLNKRGVNLQEIAELVMFLQKILSKFNNGRVCP